MSSQRPSDRVVYQDYIAKIRYSNQLPPPPNLPKLLDIPGTGLNDSKYTGAGYASRLVREQPLNIEADAELGMPIDLIGIPGVFDGDLRGTRCLVVSCKLYTNASQRYKQIPILALCTLLTRLSFDLSQC